MQILMMLAIVAVAVTVMLAFAARAGIGRVRVVVGAVVFGLLVGVVSSEYVVDGAGEWWAEHPSTGAVLTGLLLLALTVLVVEAVVERALEESREQGRRPAAQAAATAILPTAEELFDDARDGVTRLTQIYQHGIALDELTPYEDPRMLRDPIEGQLRQAGESISRVDDGLRAVVLEHTQMLSGTRRLDGLHRHALALCDVSAQLDGEVRDSIAGTLDEDTPGPVIASAGSGQRVQFPEGRRLDWLGGPIRSWLELADALNTFDRDTAEQLGIWRPGPFPRWFHPLPDDVRTILVEYRQEYEQDSA